MKQDDTVYMNCLIISNFYHTRSQQTDCFVLHVFLFPTSARQESRAKIVITQPRRNWKDTREGLKNYSVLEYHKDSMEKIDSFLSCFKNPTTRIDQSITQTSSVHCLNIPCNRVLQPPRNCLESSRLQWTLV